MKEKAALAIAALMLASLAMGITIGTTTVTAQAGVTVSVEPSYVKGDQAKILKVTVTNNTGTLADNVVIQVLKDGELQDWDLTGVAIIPKGEKVKVPSSALKVYIAPDNVFEFGSTLDKDDYRIPKTTELVVVGEPTFIFVENAGQLVSLRTGENLRVIPREDLDDDNGIPDDKIGPRVAAALPLEVEVGGSDSFEVLENIYGSWDGTNLSPAENALLKVLSEISSITLSGGSRVKVLGDNEFEGGTSEPLRLISMEEKQLLQGSIIRKGEWLRIEKGENVVLPKGAVIETITNLGITLPENLTLIRVAGDPLVPEDSERVVTLPVGWKPTTSDGGKTLAFEGVKDNLPANQTRTFEFLAQLPSETGKYTIRVTLFARGSQLSQGTATLELDTTGPGVKSITATPQWAKENTEVTLEFEFDETVIVENITLREKNGDEVQLSLTPVEGSDNKKWTATYTTGDNKQRDGAAIINIVKVKDRAGNESTDTWDNVLFIDRVAPPAPDTSKFDNWFPATGILDKNTQFIRVASSKIKDNYPFDNENPNTVDKVIIRVGASTYEMTKDIFGNWQYLLSFTADGVYEVGVYAIDKAGNVGKETAENIVVDTNKPSVEIQSPENNKYIKDNTPLLKVLISDLGCGLENQEFEDTENKGVTITLELLDGTVIAKFNPKDNAISFSATEDNTRPSSVSPITGLAFENTWPIELPDNTYILRVVAGDTLRLENVSIRFTVDTKAPNPPADLVGSITAGTLDSPTGTKTRTFTLRGTAEPGATIKVYITTDGGVTWTEVTASRTTAGADGSWLTQIDLSAYAGRNIGIAVTATDRAGNESDRTLYGYLIYDASAPRVTITSPQTGAKTSKTSIQVTGTVTKDSWEEWSDIILTIQVGTGSVTLPVFGTGDTANFSYSVALAEGTNTIMVIVSDGMNSSYDSVTVTRTVTPWGTYAVVLVIIALILAAIAILRVKK